MSWVRRGDWWRLDGWPDVSVRITTRALGIPAGAPTPAMLRAVTKAAGERPAAVVGMEQVHGAETVAVRESVDAMIAGCDALITDRPSTTLAVRTADCLPLVAYDASRRAIGAAHAGWRGVKAQLPARWIRALSHQFQSRPEDLRVAIGPAIGRCCYEVGPEFEDWFPGFLQGGAGGRPHLDLPAAATAMLVAEGIPAFQITQPPACTVCTPETCHSYRRDAMNAGRLVALITL